MLDVEAIMTLTEPENTDGESQVRALQSLINSGTVWKMEGSMGRAAMDALKSGLCALGEHGVLDYYGNYVPSRTEVKDGSFGTIEFVNEHSPYGGVLD